MKFTARDRLRWIGSAAMLSAMPEPSSASALDSPAGLAAQEKYPRNLTKEDIDHWMTELSNWGRWGKDDQAGTVNLITAAKRKQAAALVKEGTAISMSLDADIAPKDPAAGTRYTWQHAMRSTGLNMRGTSGYAVDSITVSFHGNNTTHFDALSHFIFEGHVYNGFPANSITEWGAERNDVMPYKDGMTTRGVLIDWPRFRNVPYMGDNEAIYAQDLDDWEKKTGVRIESGDCVLLRTGRWKRLAEKVRSI